MSKTTSNKITIINFVMTIFMCNYHFPFHFFGFNSIYYFFHNFLGFIAMAIFFTFSGFLLFLNVENQDDIKYKIHKRKYSLLIPFFIWNTVYLIKNVIIPGNFKFSFYTLLTNYFLEPADGPTWYLLASYFLALISPLIVKFKHKRKLITFSFCSIIIYIYLMSIGKIQHLFDYEDWWWYPNAISYIPYYLVGVYASLYFKDFVFKTNYKKIVHIISFECFLASIIFYLTAISYLKLPFGILCIVSLWFAIPNNFFKSNFKFLTQHTFFIYVLHRHSLNYLIFKFLKFFYKTLHLTKFYEFVILYIISLPLQILLCILIVTILKLIFIKQPKIFMILSGNRVKNDFSIKYQQRIENKLKPANVNTNISSIIDNNQSNQNSNDTESHFSSNNSNNSYNHDDFSDGKESFNDS